MRRSNRARQSRYDKEFIDDSEGSDDSQTKKKKSKAKKGRGKGWLGSDFSDSEDDSESADSDWGRKKKKKRATPRYFITIFSRFKRSSSSLQFNFLSRPRAPAKKKRRGGKKKGKSKGAVKRPPPPKDSDDSDKPVVKKPRPPKQERALSPVEKRTTRGKKINYQEIIGSDSDDVRILFNHMYQGV